jgi:hypothetical protein
MNKENLAKVQPHLNIVRVHPTNISFNTNLSEDVHLARNGLKQTFTRFQWKCTGQASGEIEVEPGTTQYLISILVNTVTSIADQPETGPIPEGTEIPDAILVASIEITFSVDYISALAPNDLDPEGMQEFIQHNCPYHFWPYWRELVQNLALRAQIPVPALPSYTVPKVARPD